MRRPGVGKDVFQRYKYLATKPYQLRYKAIIPFIQLCNCSHLLEFGGFLTPFLSFQEFDRDLTLRITNVDPLSAPDLTEGPRGGWLHRSLRLDAIEYRSDESEDCFAFLGLDLRPFPKKAIAETFSMLKKMKLIAVEFPVVAVENVNIHERAFLTLWQYVSSTHVVIFTHTFFDTLAKLSIKQFPKPSDHFRMNRNVTVLCRRDVCDGSMI